jgi:hypothetical protein
MEPVLLETARPRAAKDPYCGAGVRRLPGCSFSSQRTRRADFHAFALKSGAQFPRKCDCARCIAMDTDCFAAHLDILTFD